MSLEVEFTQALEGTLEAAKAIATHAWADLNPDRLKYQMVFVKQENVNHEDFEEARKFI